MTHAVKHEADQDLGALLRPIRRIALVLVEMRDQFLLPGHSHALHALAGALHRRDRTRPFRNGLGARRGGGFGGDRFRRGRCLNRRDLGLVFLGFLGIVRRHDPIGLLGFGRHFLGQFGLLDLGLLLGLRRRSDRRIGVRTRPADRWLRGAAMSSPVRSRSPGRPGNRRDRRCADAHRQRDAADMKDERSHGRENPQPPRRFLLAVEVGHLDLAGALGFGALGRRRRLGRYPARLRARPA